LKRINHWDTFIKRYGYRIRPVVIKEIDKFRKCGDAKYGFKLLVCEGCHNVRKFPIVAKGYSVRLALVEKLGSGAV